MALCRMVDKGEASIGMPPYNGGLFSSDSAPLLEKVRLSDAAIAPIIHNLSHVKDDSVTLFVNYRDMSVQQLGSIYERLLEREPVRDSDGTITVKPNSFARKDTGSYFTPQELVDLINRPDPQPLNSRGAWPCSKPRKGPVRRSPTHLRTPGGADISRPRRGRARPEGAGPSNGKRSLLGDCRRLSVRPHL